MVGRTLLMLLAVTTLLGPAAMAADPPGTDDTPFVPCGGTLGGFVVLDREFIFEWDSHWDAQQGCQFFETWYLWGNPQAGQWEYFYTKAGVPVKLEG